MANDSNKEQLEKEYEKQRVSFISDLKRFHTNRGTPFDRIPDIGGQEIDLFYLYRKVTSLGGWHKVNHEQKWELFQEDFGLPNACTNSSEALKHIYYRYLNWYEKVNFFGEDGVSKKTDDEDIPARKKICLPVESVPLSYNYNQHKVTDAQRQSGNLSTDLIERSQYEKLEMSLRSGLPNEVDMAVNMCLLLSTEGSHSMKLDKSIHILPLLLAHIGVFDDDFDRDLETMYTNIWTKLTQRDFLRFWHESVKEQTIRSLITYKGYPYSQKELVGNEVLNVGRDLGTLDEEGQRVNQMAMIVRNLSFEEVNQRLLASNSLVYKFLMLSLHCTYGSVKQMALDTLGNLATEITLTTLADPDTQVFLEFLDQSLFSSDRFQLVRGLEILSKMCLTTVNKNIFSNFLKEKFYLNLISLLTVQDIQLIVHTLEALYKLSKAGEPFTTNIAKVHKAIDILVSLLTIEAQSFGPGSLVGIKVVEYVPPVNSTDEDTESARRPTTVIQPVNPDSINIYQIPSSSLTDGAASSQGKTSGGQQTTKPPDPPPDIQATTTNWLNATYEQKKRSKVNQVELFSEYLQFCRKFGLKNSLSSGDFLHLVKVIFHQCEVVSINRKNGDRDVFFEGLCKRTTQKPFVVTPSSEKSVTKTSSAGCQTPLKGSPAPQTGKQVLNRKLVKAVTVTPKISANTPSSSTPISSATNQTASSTSQSFPSLSQALKDGNPLETDKNALVKKFTNESSDSILSISSSMGQPSPPLPLHGQSIATAAVVTSNSTISSHFSTFPVLQQSLSKTFSQAVSSVFSSSSQSIPSSNTSSRSNSPLELTEATCAVIPTEKPVYTLTNQPSIVKPRNSNIPHKPIVSNAPLSTPKVVPVYSSLTQQSGVKIVQQNLQRNGNPVVPSPQVQQITVAPHIQGIFGQQSQSSINNSIISNSIIRGPSGVIIANHQASGTVTSTTGVTFAAPSSSLQATVVTQSISSPAVAALLTSTTQQQQTPMVLSANGALSVGGQQIPTNVVIQTPPGTIVMPSRQIMVQGGGVQQNNSANTVSFVVPQIRQSPAMAVQGVNIIQQGVVSNSSQTAALQTQQNVVPVSSVQQSILQSVVQQTTQPPPQTNIVQTIGGKTFIQQTAQQQNIIQSQKPLIQTGQKPAVQSTPVQQVQSVRPQPTVVQTNQALLQANANQNSIRFTPQVVHRPSVIQTVQPQQTIIQQHLIRAVNQTNKPTFIQNIPQVGNVLQQNPPPKNVYIQQGHTPGTQLVLPQNSNKIPVGVQLSSLPGNISSSSSSSSLAADPQQIQAPLTVSLTESQSLSKSEANNSSQTQQLNGSNQLLLSTQCNGNGSDINGYLGSPDSMCSDLPPSPMSSGIGSDKDVPNGKSTDGDQNVIRIVEKSKMNGFVHVLENGCLDSSKTDRIESLKSAQQESSKLSNTVNGIASQTAPEPEQVIIRLPKKVQDQVHQQQQLRAQQRIATNSKVPQGTPTYLIRESALDNNNSIEISCSTKDISLAPTVVRKPLVKTITVVPKKQPARGAQKKKFDGIVVRNVKGGQHISMEYMCEWGNCRRCFASSKLVFLHVYKQHIPPIPESSCKWASCEKLVRKRWSLVSHVQDQHCSEMAMRQANQRRHTVYQSKANGNPVPPPPPQHQPMIYPPDAAIQAIKRFSIKPPYPEFADQREGPVSKHIRLTAALILRNISHCSSLGRSLIKKHENLISYNTMNPAEASTALSMCLWDILEHSESNFKPDQFTAVS